MAKANADRIVGFKGNPIIPYGFPFVLSAVMDCSLGEKRAEYFPFLFLDEGKVIALRKTAIRIHSSDSDYTKDKTILFFVINRAQTELNRWLRDSALKDYPQDFALRIQWFKLQESDPKELIPLMTQFRMQEQVNDIRKKTLSDALKEFLPKTLPDLTIREEEWD